MLKKSLKIKGVEGRTALIEFAVNKRVKYLEYLKELHSEEGALWMNTIQLNLAEIGRYFNIADACLPQDREGGGKDGLVHLPAEPLTALDGREAASSAPAVAATSSENFSGDRTAFSPTAATTEAVTVSIANAPAAMQMRSGSATDWARYYLPCYAALAISLSETLLVPIGGEDFVECFYGLMLELEVVYAGGPATKALAQRNLKSFRQRLSPGLKSWLQTSHDGDFGEAAACASPPTSAGDIDVQIKYLFLNQRHLEYSASSPCYDAVLPALCSVLMFAYRRLCDYELMRDEECVKRILSIDKRLERLFFKHVSHELDKIANYKLLREAYILSTSALFAELDGVARGAGTGALGPGDNFVSDLLNQQQERRNVSSPSASGGKKAFDSSSEDDEDGVGWSGNEDEL